MTTNKLARIFQRFLDEHPISDFFTEEMLTQHFYDENPSYINILDILDKASKCKYSTAKELTSDFQHDMDLIVAFYENEPQYSKIIESVKYFLGEFTSFMEPFINPVPAEKWDQTFLKCHYHLGQRISKFQLDPCADDFVENCIESGEKNVGSPLPDLLGLREQIQEFMKDDNFRRGFAQIIRHFGAEKSEGKEGKENVLRIDSKSMSPPCLHSINIYSQQYLNIKALLLS